jgi:hypothetical protein
VALFSQDDIGEDNERDNSPDFSGGEEPQDPDAVSESPVPEAVDQADSPEPVPADDSSAYGQSVEDEEPHDPAVAAEDDGGGAVYGAPAPQDSRAAQLPQAPVFGDWSADRAALERQYAQEAQQNVKPSVGRRILAGLAGGAVSFGGGNGAQTVQDVLNRPAQRAQAQWQRQERPLQQQLANDQAQDTAAQRNYQNQRVAANDAALNEQRQQRAVDFAAQAEQRNANWQPDDPTKPLGSYHATGLKGQPLKSDGPPPSVLKRPDVIAAQRQADVASLRTEGTAQGLKGDDLNSYALTGKIPNKPNPREPRQPAVGEVELNAATTAFKLEHNGRGPQTLDEQNQVIQASKGMMDRRNDPSQIIIDSATRYADGLQRVPEGNKFLPAGSYVPASISAQDVQQGTLPANVKPIPGKVYEDTLQKARDQIRQHGDDVDQNWNLVKGGGRTQPAQPASTQQPEAPKQIPPQQQPVTPGRPVAVDPKEKYILHNGQKAVARGGKWVYVNNGQEVK